LGNSVADERGCDNKFALKLGRRLLGCGLNVMKLGKFHKRLSYTERQKSPLPPFKKGGILASEP
jgi:hypothetical protein